MRREDGEEEQRRQLLGTWIAVSAERLLHRFLPETVSRAVSGSCDKAKLRRITHRDLRHTFASHLRLQGVPLEDIKDLLAHGHISVTLRYAHISYERYETAARALEAVA